MINHYSTVVRGKVNAMTWKIITNILILQREGMQIDEGTDWVLLVEPDPNNRAAPRTRIVTKAISQLLWDLLETTCRCLSYDSCLVGS